MAHRPIITLTTDFGTNDHFVGIMKGVILDILPEAEIVDICHSVQAFDVLDGALTISQAYSYFPSRTVHIVVAVSYTHLDVYKRQGDQVVLQ